MSPEITNNILHTIYLTFTHNQLVIAYVIGFIVSVFLTLWKPNRFSLLMLLGFLTLAFGYEYDKHLVGPLMRQTLDSLAVTQESSSTLYRYTVTFLGELLPMVFYLIGWLLIFLGLVIGTRAYNKAK